MDYSNKQTRSSDPRWHRKDSKLAKPNDHWLNPTTTSNRFTALQEEDLDNNPPPGKEATPKPPQFISPVSLTYLPYSNCLIKSPLSYTKSKPLCKIKSRSNQKILNLAALLQKPF
jgi:hypothetical protein